MTRPRRHSAARRVLEEAATHERPLARGAGAPTRPPATAVSGDVDDQPTIDQAMGMLMAYYGISGHIALIALRRWSVRAGVSIDVMAQAIVQLASQPSLHPFGALRVALRSFALDLDAEDGLTADGL